MMRESQMTYSFSNFDNLPKDLDLDLVETVDKIAKVACHLSYLISIGSLSSISLNQETSTNSDGDKQKALDVYADEAYLAEIKNSPVKFYASEEQDEVIDLESDGRLALAIDPLDGSSNIDTNVSIGSIFSIRRISEKQTLDKNNIFLAAGSEQIAAGYIIFGPQTMFVVTFGNGVKSYILDRNKNLFIDAKIETSIPADTREYAVNASNARHWEKRMKNYIDDSIAGKSGPRGIDFNMRWVASLVAETHRILSRGGIFIYPADSRKGYEKGRLRMVYECAPIAFLIEQAGGAATDSFNRILDLEVDELHQRTPFAFGSKNEIARLQAYNDLPEAEVSPLFGKRGLFSN